MAELTQSVFADCPYCGEQGEFIVDLSAGEHEYTEDCWVCCRPIVLTLHIFGDEASLTPRREDD